MLAIALPESRTRSLLSRFLQAAMALLVAGWFASACAQPSAGQDYVQINPPLNTDAGAGRIEVTEFFWYGCPHCHALEPEINPWIKKLPKDVTFRRIPAMFNDNWAVAGRIFYTLEAMNELERLHTPLFDAIHKDNLRVTNKSALDEWLKRNNVDVAKFDATAKSFAVESRVKRAVDLTHAVKQMDGVPAIVVNGRQLVVAGSPKKMLETTDFLIESARKGGK